PGGVLEGIRRRHPPARSPRAIPVGGLREARSVRGLPGQAGRARADPVGRTGPVRQRKDGATLRRRAAGIRADGLRGRGAFRLGRRAAADVRGDGRVPVAASRAERHLSRLEDATAAVRAACETTLRRNWREGVRRSDGLPFAYTCPSPHHYPWQWYWD